MKNKNEIAKNIIGKINDKWLELQKDFYICYSVKELAYKVAYDLLDEYYKDGSNCAILCKKWGNKWKVAIYFEQNVYLIFDIWWTTGFCGDTGLHIGNGKLHIGEPKGYEYIENVLEDNE